MKLWIGCIAVLLFTGCRDTVHDLRGAVLKIDMDLPDEQGVIRRIHHEARVIHDSIRTYYQLPKMHARHSGDSSLVQAGYRDADWFVYHQGNAYVTDADQRHMPVDSFLKGSGFSFRLEPSPKEQLMSRSRSGDSLLLTYRNMTLHVDTDPDESMYYFLPQPSGWHFSLSPAMDSLGLGRLVRMRMIYHRPAREYVFGVSDTVISRKALPVDLTSH